MSSVRTESRELTEAENSLLHRVEAAARRWSQVARVVEFERVSAGSSSLTYRATLVSGRKRRPCFVKVAPTGLQPTRNRDVLRQAAMLRLLAGGGRVPVPTVLLSHAGLPPDVPPFFVSDAVPGESVEPLVDDAALPAAAALRARTLAAASTLARLHALDPADAAAVDGARAGDPVDLAAEVGRWDRVFDTLEPALGTVGHRCADALHRTAPAPLPAAIVHGDFRLGNLICQGLDIGAVLDWEIWSVTDPRIDVGWFLMTLSADGLPSAIRATADGLPSPAEVLAAYERERGARLTDLAWFAALSRFRAAAAMGLNVKHNRRRPSPSPRIERYAERLPAFLAVAESLL